MTTPSNKTKIKKFAAESLMIIFSVLFALFINKWSDSLKEQKQTAVILDNIKLELKENKEITEEFASYHKNVYNRIKTVIKQDSIKSYFYPDEQFILHLVAPNGVIQKSFKSIAWEVSKQEQLTTRIPFEQSRVLFNCYEQQKSVNDTIDRIIDLISSREMQRKSLIKESIIMLRNEFNELYLQEENLLRKFKYADKVLNG